jgi:hypothetical protein
MVLSLHLVLGAVIVVIMVIAVGAGGIVLIPRYPGFGLGIAIAGAAGTWLSLMGLAVLWMADRHSIDLVAQSGLAAIVSAVLSVNAGCWWLSARAGRIATGATAVVATILFIVLFVLFVPFVFFGAPAV